ncbi:MAG TPA: PAS domain-containing protein [Rhizomicrobium sp.]|nr:PAS domain-containing protein [Rhizomicrobium sp.]
MSMIEFERVFAEFENTISSAALKEVARYWRDLVRTGRLPGWNDIRPSAIKTHLPIVWCYDYDPGLDDFVGRLAGYEITGVSNKPFKGTRLSELRPNDKYPRALIRAKRVVQEPALYRGHGIVYKTEERRGFGERIVMPLVASQSQPAGIFGATEYKSVSEWARSAPDLNAEEEKWFSLAGLVDAPQLANC